MNREPIGLYLFRFICGFALVLFMSMLYWSSVLQEDHLKEMKEQLTSLRNDMYQWHGDADKTRAELLQALVYRQESKTFSTESDLQTTLSSTIPLSASSNQKQPGDDRYPNLLEPDPFYLKTLPEKLLPKGFSAKGSFHSDAVGKPENLHPFSNWSNVATWHALCSVTVGQNKFGIYETLSPGMALKIEERINATTGLPEFWIFLRDNVFWAPLEKRFFSAEFELAPHFLRKHKVTAHDFKFYIDAILNPSLQESGAVSLRNYLGDISAVEVIDELTFVVRWRGQDRVMADGQVKPMIEYAARQRTATFLQPLPSFVYKYFADGSLIVEGDSPDLYQTSSIWAQNFTHHWAKNIIVSCGPWLFDGMTDEQISFRRNADFYEPLAALAERYIFHFRGHPDALWLSFKAQKSDSYLLQPDKLSEWSAFKTSSIYQQQAKEAGMEVKRLDYIGLRYSYIGWNNKRVYFNSTKTRQAMTMAIDRRRIIDQFMNGMGVETTGPFSPLSKAYDKSIEPWPFDPLEAQRLLHEEGWVDRDGDGTIEKLIDGEWVPFTFSLNYYVKDSRGKAIAEFIASSLKEIGVLCNPNGLDVADLTRMFDEKNFDALMMNWVGGAPPYEPRQLWHSSGASEKGSSNMIGFVNEEVDKIIDELAFTYDRQQRIALYRRFDQIIHQEQPYTFLAVPKMTLLYRSYLQNVFIPAEQQKLIPGADIEEPQSSIFWLDKK